MREINLPIIEKIDIKGYQMYPGVGGEGGLCHSFIPGTNVIVGINGLGKTTLLGIISRTLIGSKDIPTKDKLGAGQRELVTPSNAKNEFAKKVADNAAKAQSMLTFTLGRHRISICRSLKDLSIISYSFDGLLYESNKFLKEIDIEESYQESIIEAANIDNYYDFILLTRYLIFYLEDRRSLAWDEWAQTEILRILFVPSNLQQKYKESYDEAAKSDSDARNIENSKRLLQKSFDKILQKLNNVSEKNVYILQAEVEGLKDNYLGALEFENECNKKRYDERQKLSQRRHDLAVISRKILKIREDILGNIFPALNDYGKLVVAEIKSHNGCIVCGCRDAEQMDLAIKRITDQMHCPICGAIPQLQEQTKELSYDLTNESLEDLERQRKLVSSSIVILEHELREAESVYDKIQNDRVISEQKYKSAQKELTKIFEVTGAAEGFDPTTQAASIKELDDAANLAWADKNNALRELEYIVNDLTANSLEFKDKLIYNFNELIKCFLAEECTLNYKTIKRKIGQGRQEIDIIFPEFYINMTSGVFLQSGVHRESIDSVSESQKEFVELALRLAFIRTAISPNQTSLLIETPEANLDVVFITMAGLALREFTMTAELGHVLIASSNLNGTSMIPSILGRTDSYGERVITIPASEDKQVLNLLKVAAQNRALKEYSDQYQHNLNKALYN